MSAWLTIEVQSGDTPAEGWRRSHGELLIEAAVTNGAREWTWHAPAWGVILELEFSEEQARDAFRRLPALVAALDAVPDPVLGLYVYPGRGGGSTTGLPRSPRPSPAQGSAALDEPLVEFLDLTRDDGSLSATDASISTR